MIAFGAQAENEMMQKWEYTCKQLHNTQWPNDEKAQVASEIMEVRLITHARHVNSNLIHFVVDLGVASKTQPERDHEAKGGHGVSLGTCAPEYGRLR